MRLFTAEFYENPYPVYQWFRTEDPVRWDEDLSAWVLSRHKDVTAALNDPRLARGSTDEEHARHIKSLIDQGQADYVPLYDLTASMMLFTDPPKHTRLRSLANRAFTPRIVELIRPDIERTIDELLDLVEPAGQMDIIGDLAYPLPLIILCELLGLPTDDRERFKCWSDDIIAFTASYPASMELKKNALASLNDLTPYFTKLLAHLRERADANLLGALVAAHEQGDRLSKLELLANAVLLLMNGHETTTYQIGNSVLALLRNPHELERLKSEPELINTAVEEFFRYDGSVQVRGLTAGEDFRLDGKRIRRGETVLLLIGSANRDPTQFTDPDRLDIGRQENRHLTFGRGIHYCIGAALARAEVELAIQALLHRMPELRLGTGSLDWHTIPVFRGLRQLPVTFRRNGDRS